jgi:hypothetical protein
MPRLRSTAWFWIAGALVACGGGTSDLFDESGGGPVTGEGGEGAETSSGGSGKTGGTLGAGGSTGGRAQGGNAQGGAASGGTATGGRAQGGGSGGDPAGGSTNGGSSNGGSSNGGSMNGGSTNGGSTNGGSTNGGSATGGKSSGGVGGAGGKNTGGGPGGMKCTDPDGSDARTRGTAKGTNGSFQDECVQGELVEYVCETEFVVGPNCPTTNAGDAAPFRPIGGSPGMIAPPIECVVQTGKVVESQVDCGGRCRDGTCFYWCPSLEDEVEYLQVQGGEVRLQNTTSQFRYQCEVVFERDGVDCSDPDLEGHTAGVYSTGACTATQVVFGTESEADPDVQSCTYDCVLVD